LRVTATVARKRPLPSCERSVTSSFEDLFQLREVRSPRARHNAGARLRPRFRRRPPRHRRRSLCDSRLPRRQAAASLGLPQRRGCSGRGCAGRSEDDRCARDRADAARVALRLQSVAIGGKWPARKAAQISGNRCRGLRPVAAETPWVRRGSAVRVRQGALQSAANRRFLVRVQSALGSLRAWMEPFMELSRRERPWSAGFLDGKA
jgi:hypothetical protein